MFDPYHKWLGISDAQRPPNHYRLLGLELFESDREVIQSASDRQMTHVRQFQSGEHAELSQVVLNEIAQARVCLLQGNTKTEYDKRLRSSLARMEPPVASESVAVPSTGLPKIDAVRQNLRDRTKKKSLLPLLFATIGLAVVFGLYYVGRRVPDSGDQGNEEAAQVVDSSSESPVDSGNVDSSAIGEVAELPGSISVVDSTESSVPTTSAADVPSSNDEPSVPNVPQPIPPWRQSASRAVPPPIPAKHPFVSCLTALRQREMTTAKRQLAAIEKRLMSNPSQRDAVSRLRLFVGQVDSFWRAVDIGLQDLAVGDAFSFAETPVSVRALEAGKLALRCGAEERIFETRLASLDSDLAVALCEMGADAFGPARDWMIGSFLSIDNQGDLNAASQRLERARGSGAAIELLADLKQPSSTSKNTSPRTLVQPPSKRDFDLANRKMHQEFRTLLNARTPEQKRGASDEMYEASVSKKDVAYQYALLNKSILLAASAGDFGRAWNLVDYLGERYKIDRHEVRIKVLMDLSGDAGQDLKSLLLLSVEEARSAVGRNDFDRATQYNNFAAGIARRLQDKQITRYLKLQQANLKIFKREYASLGKALEKLKLNADDPSASTAMGKFLCLTVGDFDRGLPYLKSSDDELLREIAQHELSESKLKPKAIADGWWEFARSTSGIKAANARKRAALHYSAALMDPAEIERERIEANLKHVAKHDEDVLFDLLLMQLVSAKWRVEWSNADVWESLTFNGNGSAQLIGKGGVRRPNASWRKTANAIELLGADKVSVYRIVPVSMSAFRIKKKRLKQFVSGTGTRIVDSN